MGGSKPGSNYGGSGGSSLNPSSGGIGNQTYSKDFTPRYAYELVPNNQNQRKKKKPDDRIDFMVTRDGQIIIRVLKDGKPYFILENDVRRKIYHLPYFGVPFPNLDLDKVRGLKPKELLEYLSKPDVLELEDIVQGMKNMADHLLNSEIIDGTLGKNGELYKNWNPAVKGKHAYNPDTHVDLVFAEDGQGGYRMKTGMELNNAKQRDLDRNQNIL